MEWVSTRLQKQVILAESCGGKPGGDPVVNEIELFESETGSEMEYGEEFDFTWLCRTSEDLGIRQCYQYFKIPATWHDAQEICQDQGGHLATIQNSMANSMVQLVFKLGRARNPDAGGNVWIGLKENRTHGVFMWSNLQPMNYSNWAVGQPALMTNQTKCVLAKTDKVRQWETENCDLIFLFICETYDRGPIDNTPTQTDDPIPKLRHSCAGEDWYKRKGKCYQYLSHPVDWSEGREKCRNNGGRMLTLESLEEYNFVQISVRPFMGNGQAWTGLRKDKKFTWDSRRDVDREFLGFLTSGASNLRGDKRRGCYSLTTIYNHPLFLEQCDETYGVICEVYTHDYTWDVDRLTMTPWNVYPTKLEHHVDEDLNRTDIIDAHYEKPMTPGGPMDVNSKMSDLEQTVNEEEQQYANSLRTSYVKQEQCHVGWNQLTKFKCYKYMDSAATWYDAKLQCQKMDSSLVTFETGDELSVVHEHYGFLIVGIGAWTGLRNDGQLTWDSNHTIQEEFLESALGTGGLEGIAQKRGCFYLQKSDEKKLLVDDCEKELPYICDFYTNRRKKFIQDKFSPAAKEKKINHQDDLSKTKKKTQEARVIANKPFVADNLERSVHDDLLSKKPHEERHTVASKRRKAHANRLFGEHTEERLINGAVKRQTSILSNNRHEMASLHG